MHRFYPLNLQGDDPLYKESEEFQRLLAARQSAMASSQAWSEFLERLRAAVPPGVRVEDWTTLTYDACRRCRLYLPGTRQEAGGVKAVVVLASILVPVYAIYASHQIVEGQRVTDTRLYYPPLPAEFLPLEAVLDDLLQSSLDLARIPNEVLFTSVPDLQVGNKYPHEVQLIDCLFTDDRS